MSVHATLLACLLASSACGTINSRSDDDGEGSGADGGADPCPETGCSCEGEGECSPHQECVGEGEKTCECAAGYDGAPCAWVGVVTDPGFLDDAAWDASRGARVLTSEPGPVDLGMGFFDQDASCALGGLSQSVTMPDYARAEPLVAEVTFVSASGKGIALGFDATWTIIPGEYQHNPEEPQWTTTRFCLGASAYGGERTLTVAPAHRDPSCGGQAHEQVMVDHLDIVPAEDGECAPPGDVVNGDAEGEGGWTFQVSGDTPTAGLVDGEGAMGSRAAHMAHDTTCDSSVMTTALSVAAAPTPTALELWYKATNGSLFEIDMGVGRDQVLRDRGDGLEHRVRFCLPPYYQGSATSIFAYLIDEFEGFCGEPLVVPSRLAIDDVRLVDDPSCAASAGFADSGFDSAVLPFGQHAQHSGDRAEVTADTTHAGAGAFWIRSANRGSDPGIGHPIVVPNGPKPAVRVWLRTNGPTDVTNLYVHAGSLLTIAGESATWNQQVFCIDPAYAGRPTLFHLFLNAGPGPTGPLGSVHDWWIDELTLSASDPACPMP